MILPKDIFKTTKEYIRFLLYLYSEKIFTVEKLSLEFNISKWVLYKQLKSWKRQKYTTVISKVGEEGGKLYYYQTTDKLELHLKDILTSLLKSRGFKEPGIKKIIEKK